MALTMAHQLRAARSMLRWEQEQLASAAGVAVGTIKRIEASDGSIPARFETVRKIQQALEQAGAIFTNGDEPGVKLGKPAAGSLQAEASA